MKNTSKNGRNTEHRKCKNSINIYRRCIRLLLEASGSFHRQFFYCSPFNLVIISGCNCTFLRKTYSDLSENDPFFTSERHLEVPRVSGYLARVRKHALSMIQIKEKKNKASATYHCQNFPGPGMSPIPRCPRGFQCRRRRTAARTGSPRSSRSSSSESRASLLSCRLSFDYLLCGSPSILCPPFSRNSDQYKSISTDSTISDSRRHERTVYVHISMYIYIHT